MDKGSSISMSWAHMRLFPRVAGEMGVGVVHAVFVGVVVFGPYKVPVRLYAAKEEREAHHTLLCRTCATPLRQRRWCPTCNRDVEPSEVVKGVKEGERYVLISETDAGVSGAGVGVSNAGASDTGGERRITIDAFVRPAEVDPVYFEKAYLLEPAAGGESTFRLFKRALEKSERAALGRVMLWSRESPALLRTYGKTIALHTLSWQNDVRKVSTLELGGGAVRSADLKKALDLIEAGATGFVPALLKRPARVSTIAGSPTPRAAR